MISTLLTKPAVESWGPTDRLFPDIPPKAVCGLLPVSGRLYINIDVCMYACVYIYIYTHAYVCVFLRCTVQYVRCCTGLGCVILQYATAYDMILWSHAGRWAGGRGWTYVQWCDGKQRIVLYVWMHVRMCVCKYVCMYACKYVCKSLCLRVCRPVCRCMYICM